MSIYQHFRPEERGFIDQVLNWKEYVEERYAPKLTDFLDPREQQIVNSIVGGQNTRIAFFGGTDDTERKRAFLYPDYYELTEDDFQITLFEVKYPSKFITLTHPQVLGSLMSIGIKREKFGDILLSEQKIQFFCAGEIADYVRLEVKSMGKATIELIAQPLSQAIIQKEQWDEVLMTVSSLRLDVMISNIYQISRQKSQTLIQSGLVKVNWKTIENPSFECGVGDTLSVRRFGRSKILSFDGLSKKEKWKILIGKQK
ncbi:RNA-binding protein [Niallia sp. Krafla_26]|uniref:YlmH family RNA-binding protein n=1 Tax=Niallia sp. Krafla_26 TaxID=3064703 RepID=UPI003D17F1DF